MSNPQKKRTTREWALRVLLEASTDDKHLDTVLHGYFEQEDFSVMEKKNIKRLVYGVVERQIFLDALISRFSKIKLNKMKPKIRMVLRMGLYEMLYMDSVPDRAACNEAVQLTKNIGLHGLSGFVNGMMRNMARNKEKLVPQTVGETYAMPDWLVEKIEAWYPSQAEVILGGMITQSPMTLRVNRARGTKEELIRMLIDAGVEVLPGVYCEEAIRIRANGAATELPGYQEGLFAIQDESSMLPAKVSGIQTSDIVIDVCAAPGGKTMQAAEMTGATGMVYARDLTEYKCQKIRENAARLGFQNIQVECKDATKEDTAFFDKADVVMADVPCSGLGIIGRKPDIKYHIKKETLQELVRIQRRIVSNAVSFCKPGGIMIYSTCTINPEENETMIHWMVEHLPVTLESLNDYLPSELQCESSKSGMLQILPGVHKSDGFFVARLRKEGER